MSAPDKRHGQHSQTGTESALPYGGAPKDATGQGRSYVGEAAPSGYAQSHLGQGVPGYSGYTQSASQNPYAGYPGYATYGQYGQIGQNAPQAYHYGQHGQVQPGVYQVPPTSVPTQVKPRRRWPVVVGIVIAIICIALAVLLALTMCDVNKSRRQGDAGQLKGKTDAEVQAELDRVVEEGMFNISIASVVDFESGTAPGDLRIENVPGNRYLMLVTLIRNDTGEQIYQTDVIEPDHHIQTDTLDVDLPQGSYECTALFEALDPETEEQVGQAGAVITLNVRS